MKKENTSNGEYAGKRSVSLIFSLWIILFFPMVALADGSTLTNNSNQYYIDGTGGILNDGESYEFNCSTGNTPLAFEDWFHHVSYGAITANLGSNNYVVTMGTGYGDGAGIILDSSFLDCGSSITLAPYTAPSPGGNFALGPGEVFPGYESSTTFMIIDNPTQDMFNAELAFVGGFVILIWLFKGRK